MSRFIKSSRAIIKSLRLSLFEDVLSINQHEVKRFRVSHPGAVVILATTEKDQIVLIKQYRHCIDSYILEIPAGTLSPGEGVLNCAKRELKEETGYEAGKWEELGILYPAPGFCDEKQHLFHATNLSPGIANPEANELIELQLISFGELTKLVETKKILDAKTLATIYRAYVLGLIGNK